jgi:hypothetical protein
MELIRYMYVFINIYMLCSKTQIGIDKNTVSYIRYNHYSSYGHLPMIEFIKKTLLLAYFNPNLSCKFIKAMVSNNLYAKMLYFKKIDRSN